MLSAFVYRFPCMAVVAMCLSAKWSPAIIRGCFLLDPNRCDAR
ncbi:hypothetical protein OMAG_002971 [Candidatus Omnitrophus magneticus]|uniref:Uncharacterized protein n=1 Tax=Candidatus Omnitrophus magneticus TaxID=1609969 RepID=A0A0F0CNT4_9BACT|nr:hypothetical protein OMAG_002971 [Candidatus Omnitrophus magneticus]